MCHVTVSVICVSEALYVYLYMLGHISRLGHKHPAKRHKRHDTAWHELLVKANRVAHRLLEDKPIEHR